MYVCVYVFVCLRVCRVQNYMLVHYIDHDNQIIGEIATIVIV